MDLPLAAQPDYCTQQHKRIVYLAGVRQAVSCLDAPRETAGGGL